MIEINIKAKPKVQPVIEAAAGPPGNKGSVPENWVSPPLEEVWRCFMLGQEVHYAAKGPGHFWMKLPDYWRKAHLKLEFESFFSMYRWVVIM